MMPARKRKVVEDRRKGDQRSGVPRRSKDRWARNRDRAAAAVAVGCLAGGWWSLQTQSDEIQQQRSDNVRRTCVDQNRRHDNAQKTLTKLISEVPPGPQRDRASANEPATLLLIEAIVPRQDCDELVKKAVQK